MNISINITYTSGTKVELIVPLEEPAQIVSEPESQPKKPGNWVDVMKHCDSLSASQGKATVAPDPIQPAQDLADAMAGIPVLTDEELELLKSSGKRYTSVNELIDDLCKDPESGRTMSMYNMTYTTIDGKEWQVPPGLMKDLVIIYGEKTVEQELLKAHAWLEADPQRRKTPRGMGRFLNGWLSRASSMVRTPIKTLLKRDSLMSTNGTQESW
jgi:hypothetical protein